MRRGNAQHRHKHPREAAKPHAKRQRASSALSWARDLRNSCLVASDGLTAGRNDMGPEREVSHSEHEDVSHQGGVSNDIDDFDPIHLRDGECGEAHAEGSAGYDLESPEGKTAMKHMRLQASILIHEWGSRGKVPASCVHWK
jgi:hypothetical protein